MAESDCQRPLMLPEHLTQLYYSPIYTTLNDKQRWVYNRLHACFLCEFYVFFEETFPRYYANAAGEPGMPQDLVNRLNRLLKDECHHADMFRKLLAELHPELYRQFRFHFVRLPQPVSWLTGILFRYPSLSPVILWIALLQEERALYFAREILRYGPELEKSLVSVHRRHLADEVAHLSVEEDLLKRYWDNAPHWLRRLNARLFSWSIAEFLVTPQRGAARLLDRWLKECPELAPQADQLRQAMAELRCNHAFRLAQYSRDIAPRTYALLDRQPEFAGLGAQLPGYTRPAT